MKTIEELKSDEEKLWDQVKALEVPYKEKQSEWLTVRQEIERRELRASVLAEILAEKNA